MASTDQTNLCELLKSIGGVPSELERAPLGTAIQVPKCFVRFRAFLGPPQKDTHNKKSSVIEIDGNEQYAELVILKTIQDAGWSGRWIDNWSRKFWVNKGKAKPLPPRENELFERICALNGGRRGCWDILAWRESEILLVEVKRQGKDRVKLEQWKWLELTLGEIPTALYFIVEWNVM